MRPDQRDAAHLWDMLQAARAVQRFVEGVALEEYRQDLKLRSAVERQLELIGEAAARISAELRGAHEKIPWKAIIGQRNILAHDYGEIDDARVFAVAVNDVPRLIEQDRASRTSVDMILGRRVRRGRGHGRWRSRHDHRSPEVHGLRRV